MTFGLKSIKNPSKINQKPSEINQNGAQERFETELETCRCPGPRKMPYPGVRAQAFGATWAILGAILAPAGPQLGPKIEHFRIKIEKLVSQRAFKKRCWKNIEK